MANAVVIHNAVTEGGIDWFAELRQAVKAHPRGKAGVAVMLGVSRGYVSQIMNGYYLNASPEFIVRVVERLCATRCPHLGRDIPHASCREYAARRWEAISQFEVEHWRTCQRCTCKAPPALPVALKPKPENWVFVPHPSTRRAAKPAANQGATP